MKTLNTLTALFLITIFTISVSFASDKDDAKTDMQIRNEISQFAEKVSYQHLLESDSKTSVQITFRVNNESIDMVEVKSNNDRLTKYIEHKLINKKVDIKKPVENKIYKVNIVYDAR